MVVETGVHITGEGKIEKLEVHDDGVVIDKSVDVKPENIWVEDDVEIKIGDETYTGGDDYLDKKPGGDNGGGGGTPSTPTTYTVTVALMTDLENRGKLANSGVTSITGQSITKEALNLLVASKDTTKYAFAGWYTTDTPTGTKLTDADFPITKNITLYARFNGVGDATNPIEITSVADLNEVRNGLGKDYKLMTNLDLSDGWVPIGDNSATDLSSRFRGTFNGEGNKITFATTFTSDVIDIGLFGVIDEIGTVKNLEVAGTITNSGGSRVNAGAVAGLNYGKIESCVSTAKITINGSMNVMVGGIVGYNYGGSFADCYSTGDVTATTTSATADAYAGGITGLSNNYGSINRCYATGAIEANTGTGRAFAGGIAGDAESTGAIHNCVALNESVTAVGGTRNIGRIVGNGGDLVNNRAIEMTGLTDTGALDGVDGLEITVTQARTKTTYSSSASWDFTTTDAPWVIKSGTTYILPVLRWQFTAPTIPDHLKDAAGTSTDPILISTPEQLAAVGVNDSLYYKLVADLNLAQEGVTWTPIGDNSTNTDATRFTGTFDGNGHTLTLTSFATALNEIGVFGTIGTDGTVKNLEVTGTIDYTASSLFSAGAVAGRNNGGTIEGCVSTANITVTGSNNVFVGGIVGLQYGGGKVNNCYSTGNLTASTTNGSSPAAGGIAGMLYESGSTISKCYSTGVVSASSTSTGDAYAGGIAGNIASGGTIENCVALNSSVSASTNGAKNVGRIGGNVNFSTVADNYGSSDMTGSSDMADSGWTNTDSNAKDGTDCAAIPDDTWWTGTPSLGWDWAYTWFIPTDGGYPTLNLVP